MKNLAKLVLFFVLCFVLILFLTGAIWLLHAWTENAILFPAPAAFSGDPAGEALWSAPSAARTALPAALYIAILLGLTFAAHRKIPYPAAFPILLVLSLGLSTAASLGLNSLSVAGAPPGTDNLKTVKSPVTMKAPKDLGRPGLIFSAIPGEGRVPVNAGAHTQSVIMESTGKGARIISIPGQPLYYQESLPYQAEPVRLPFANEIHPVLQGISEDLAKSSRYLAAWFNAGLIPFMIYSGSLSLLLISIGCLVNISFWSLANLFFGALAFRGILALEALLNSGEIHDLLSFFAGGFVPESLINPAIFCTLGLLILLYAGLVYLARGRRTE
jgi:hypothetical protein